MNNENLVVDKNKKEDNKGLIKVFLITFAIAILIRTFIAQPFIINGSSMEPTFENGEYIIIDEITYKFREPKRGEVIVFKYPQNTSKYFIKRIIGLPGETIEIKNNNILITGKDGKVRKLSEDYIDEPTNGDIKVKLGEDEYFVLGDNRIVSSDSRKWGPVSKDFIIGRAVARFLPITHAGILPGDYSK